MISSSARRASFSTPPPACLIPPSTPKALASSPAQSARMASADAQVRARFPLPCRPRLGSRRSDRQALVGQSAPHDAAQRGHEAVSILAAPRIVSERLFLDVAVQMVGLHVDVGALD